MKLNIAKKFLNAGGKVCVRVLLQLMKEGMLRFNSCGLSGCCS